MTTATNNTTATSFMNTNARQRSLRVEITLIQEFVLAGDISSALYIANMTDENKIFLSGIIGNCISEKSAVA